jgi:hypothetical protein
MGRKLVWVFAGPQRGNFHEFSEEDAQRAVDNGWGQDTTGLDGAQTAQPTATPNADADAYYAERQAASGSTYGTREMTAQGAPASAPDMAPPGDSSTGEDSTAMEESSAPKRGRPRKTVNKSAE